MDDIVKEFLVESHESLDQLDSALLELEEAPNDRDRLASIFRTVHTIKGTSGFLAFSKLERVAHVGENLLVPLRDGHLQLTSDIADGLLAMVDAIRQILSAVESTGAEGDGDYSKLIGRLEELQTAGRASRPPQPEAPLPPADARPTPGDSASPPSGPIVHPETVEPPHATTPSICTDVHTPPPATEKGAEAPSDPAEVNSERNRSVSDSSIRIDVELLDRLMNLVGELVLARNQILQFSQNADDAAIVTASQRLNLITTELQEGVMKTRMQPIQNAWSKLPRVVRDLSLACGKQVQVRMEGAETELDKTILEAIKDPLTHIVRNSVDHGIELPAKRVDMGKSPEGTLCLRAFHEGGQVNIEIADDGAGIHVGRVKQKALEKGLITPDQAAAMSDRELMGLILLPGFSTAEKVTNVSGRGVGMDVVKTNIERIGGSLDIHSVAGEGTTLRIKIPLTLAIVPALIVTTSGERYAIPQVSLLELVRLDEEHAREDIEFIYDVPVYRLRGNLLPLIYLDEQLELRTRRPGATSDQVVNIVVLQAENRQFGLVVDAINDTQEIVVKPLDQHLKGLSTYAGATIMGDGKIALILDVIGLAQKGGVLSEHHDRALRDTTAPAAESLGARQSLLIVDRGDGTRAALPISTVARLEEFEASKVERTAHGAVIQYRGKILPLIHLSSEMQYGSSYDSNGSETFPAVVYSAGDVLVGIVVGRIVDIVEHRVDSQEPTPSCRGTHIIQQRVTEVLDLEWIVRSAQPELFASPFTS